MFNSDVKIIILFVDFNVYVIKILEGFKISLDGVDYIILGKVKNGFVNLVVNGEKVVVYIN